MRKHRFVIRSVITKHAFGEGEPSSKDLAVKAGRPEIVDF
jgi:hypothetical protein